MESIGKAYIRGVYQDGSIHSDEFSIRVFTAFPIIGGERFYIGDIYLDALDRPYLAVTVERDADTSDNSFINILMHPSNNNSQLEQVVLQDGQEIWVDFRNIQEKCVGYYQCVLEFRDGIWYFVPKGVDKVNS